MHRHCVATGLGLAALLVCLCSQGQDYADFTLRRGFVSQSGSGETGGDLDAQEQFGAACLGLIDRTPDHLIDVQEDLTLTLTVDSTTDSTLIVQGPSGVFCDDDSAGGNDARISARLAAGQYAVYVGDIQQSGYYRLTLSEGEAPLPKENKKPVQQYADFKFGRASKGARQVSGGHTGGGAQGHALDASAVYGGDCAGIIDETADHHLFVISQVALDFALESTTDATLLISGPDGLLLCEPNRAGSADLALQGSLLPGRYEVYVGHRSEAGAYRLTVTELAGD